MKRSEQRIEDTWDLEKIFATSDDFYSSLKKAESVCEKIVKYDGKLGDDNSLLEVLGLNDELAIILECCANYSYMKLSQDGADSDSQKMWSNFYARASAIEEKTSFLSVQIVAIDEKRFDNILSCDKFRDYKVMLTRLRREKAHILSRECEKIMALYSAASGMYSQCFDDMVDVDMKFGKVDGKNLTATTFVNFLHDPDASVRKKAYFKYYNVFNANKHMLSRLYEGNVKENIFKSRVRGYESVLKGKLFSDNIDIKVYLNLIEAAHKGFDLLHKFYNLKKKKLGLDKLSHFDVYLSFAPKFNSEKTYDEAVDIVIDSLSPLGDEYKKVLRSGLTSDRWVDRYANEGKSSGAYSNGGYRTMPYIMLNYSESSYRDLFTIAHEGGHSMHSYYSAKNNPFSCYQYSIFEAETASTFNERLLAKYLLANSKSSEEKLYLLSQEADDIVATFFRQTMFAEYEYNIFKKCENSEPITLDVQQKLYYKLLRSYFGKDVRLYKKSALESLRIPHFYRPFYVYKYATGITAAVILSDKVLSGGEKERDEYLGFLSRGGSMFPIENLKMAGANLEDVKSFDVILKRFGEVVDELGQC